MSEKRPNNIMIAMMASIQRPTRRRTRSASALLHFVLLQSLLLAGTSNQETPGCVLAQAYLFQESPHHRIITTIRRRRGLLLANNLGIEPVTVEEKAPPIRRTRPPSEDGAPHQHQPDQDGIVQSASASAGDAVGNDGSFVKMEGVQPNEDCTKPAGPCERCTDSERIMIPESCMDTGKRQPFHCYDKSSEGTYS